uniref:Uncharacterized protein n=1 Tax=Rhizophora mucronata TaxID=61149 RepID=A0A2P2Q5G0_RHIMU
MLKKSGNFHSSLFCGYSRFVMLMVLDQTGTWVISFSFNWLFIVLFSSITSILNLFLYL